MIGPWIDQIVKKRWKPEEIDKYVGKRCSAWLTYARDEKWRERAASGGSTTAMLADWLDSGEIDGALVCDGEVIDNKVRAVMKIVTDHHGLKRSQTSKYVETPFLRQALPLIKSFEGSLAVTALPCDVSSLLRWCEKDRSVGRKVKVIIGLVCGHNSRKELIDTVTARLEAEAGAPLKKYTFRRGLWRGYLEAEFEDGQVIRKKSGYFNDYQNLFFFSERKCMACSDHFAYGADISVGDVWLYSLKNDEVKRTAVLPRTEVGQRMFSRSCDRQALCSEPLSVESILDGQSRIAPFHYNVSARQRVGRYLGLKLKDTVNESVKWHSGLAAFISVLNMRWSESERAKQWIFRLPRPLLKFYLYILKGLETFK